jgi:hypothetical protein
VGVGLVSCVGLHIDRRDPTSDSKVKGGITGFDALRRKRREFALTVPTTLVGRSCYRGALCVRSNTNMTMTRSTLPGLS